MSGPSDKARFYLEQAVPQLQEFKEKRIFSEVSLLRKIGAARLLGQKDYLLDITALATDSILVLTSTGRDSNVSQKAIRFRAPSSRARVTTN